jgi:tetratricopeptide (TPR) repeat protein
MKKLFLFLVAATIAIQAQAQGKSETVSTILKIGAADQAKGGHLRAQSIALSRLIEQRKFADAQVAASSLRLAYEKTFDKSRQQFSFQTQAEFDEFSKTYAGKFEWIDWGYKQSLQMLAYLAAERSDFPASLALLKTIETIAPVSAGTAVEAGYVLNQSGKPEEGLATYRRALALAEKYPSQRIYQAASLRGIGFALIDLKRLDEAEQAFQKSLKIEPGNKVALNELGYIQDLRGAK